MSPEEQREEQRKKAINIVVGKMNELGCIDKSLSAEETKKTKYFKLTQLYMCFITENEFKDANKSWGRETELKHLRHINCWSLEEKQKLADKYKTDEEIKDFIVYSINSAKENNGKFSIGNFHMTLSDEMLKTIKK
jgi:hypothetical protein